MRINRDGTGQRVTAVAQGCPSGEDAVLHLLSLATFDIFRKIVHVILAHAEGDGEHEFALGRGIKPEGGELETCQLVLVEQVDDSTAVERIAGQAVRVPGKDAVGFTPLDSVEHIVEHGAARLFGRLRFNEGLDGRDAAADGQVPKLGKLVVDRSELPRHTIRRLASVDEIFVVVIHVPYSSAKRYRCEGHVWTGLRPSQDSHFQSLRQKPFFALPLVNSSLPIAGCS